MVVGAVLFCPAPILLLLDLLVEELLERGLDLVGHVGPSIADKAKGH